MLLLSDVGTLLSIDVAAIDAVETKSHVGRDPASCRNARLACDGGAEIS